VQLSGESLELSSLIALPSARQALDLERDGRETLPCLVVEGATDPKSLSLLSGQRRPGTQPPFLS
jgi:hypothetical protein